MEKNNIKNRIILKPNTKKFYNYYDSPPEIDIYNEVVPIVKDIIRVFVKGEDIYIDLDGDINHFSKDSIINRKKAIKNAEKIFSLRKKSAEEDNTFDCNKEDLEDFVEYFTKN